MTRLEAAVSELVAALREELAAATPDPAAGVDRLLGVDEAAAALGIKRTLVFAELARGRLRSVKVGRRRLVPSSSIADYIADRGAGR